MKTAGRTGGPTLARWAYGGPRASASGPKARSDVLRRARSAALLAAAKGAWRSQRSAGAWRRAPASRGPPELEECTIRQNLFVRGARGAARTGRATMGPP